MGSKTFEGVRFQVFSHDHEPAHAHGSYGSVVLVVEFEDPDDIHVRPGSTLPANAKKSQVRKVLRTAKENYSYLAELWEKTHGKSGR